MVDRLHGERAPAKEEGDDDHDEDEEEERSVLAASEASTEPHPQGGEHEPFSAKARTRSRSPPRGLDSTHAGTLGSDDDGEEGDEEGDGGDIFYSQRSGDEGPLEGGLTSAAGNGELARDVRGFKRRRKRFNLRRELEAIRCGQYVQEVTSLGGK